MMNAPHPVEVEAIGRMPPGLDLAERQVWLAQRIASLSVDLVGRNRLFFASSVTQRPIATGRNQSRVGDGATGCFAA